MTSEDKCTWRVTQEIEWTGWRINTKDFMIYVPERKIVKAADAESELLPDDPRLFSGYFWQILANFWLLSG